jgi:hypothetical protein
MNPQRTIEIEWMPIQAAEQPGRIERTTQAFGCDLDGAVSVELARCRRAPADPLAIAAPSSTAARGQTGRDTKLGCCQELE